MKLCNQVSTYHCETYYCKGIYPCTVNILSCRYVCVLYVKVSDLIQVCAHDFCQLTGLIASIFPPIDVKHVFYFSHLKCDSDFDFISVLFVLQTCCFSVQYIDLNKLTLKTALRKCIFLFNLNTRTGTIHV